MEVRGIDLGLEATGIHSHDAGMTTRVRDGRVVTWEAILPANVRRAEVKWVVLTEARCLALVGEEALEQHATRDSRQTGWCLGGQRVKGL
jgi:hypothetical protein